MSKTKVIKFKYPFDDHSLQDDHVSHGDNDDEGKGRQKKMVLTVTIKEVIVFVVVVVAEVHIFNNHVF